MRWAGRQFIDHCLERWDRRDVHSPLTTIADMNCDHYRCKLGRKLRMYINPYQYSEKYTPYQLVRK